MKISNITYNTNNNRKKPAFKGIWSKAADFMINTQEKIAAAGFIATFIAQDGIGSIIPRSLIGLTRNSKETGQINYKFAIQEACREVFTGPPAMFIPALAIGMAAKHIGPTLYTPACSTEAFTKTLKNVVTEGKIPVSNIEEIKRTFYNKNWEYALKTTCGEGYAPKKELLDNLTTLTMKLENAPKRVKKGVNTQTAKDIFGEISSTVSNELRQNANVKSAFSKIKYLDGTQKPVSSSIGEYASHMINYSKDFTKKLSGMASQPAEKIIETVDKIARKRIGARFITNLAAITAVVLYSIYVPKLYKSFNKTNPGLIGLEEKKEEQQVVQTKPVNYEAFGKLKAADNSNSSQPSFKGLGLGRIGKAVQKEGFLRKFANAFEFEGINMSFASLMSYMGFGILIPRVANAYDKHDKREILTRDIFTIAAIVGGSRVLLNVITRIFEKVSGIVMSEKAANYEQMPKWRRIVEHLRPFGGTKVYSNEEINLKYTNIDKFKDGIKGFCKFVKDSGGNLVKFFGNDKTTKSNMESMLGKKLTQATDKEIMSAVANKENTKFVENIINVFKKPDNTFIKKSKSITGVFGFISTFIAIPAFMIFLQKFNENYTKKAIAKEQAEKKAVEQKFTAVRLTTDLLEPESSKLNIK